MRKETRACVSHRTNGNFGSGVLIEVRGSLATCTLDLATRGSIHGPGTGAIAQFLRIPAVLLFAVYFKGVAMKIPVETKPAVWGVVGGAIAVAIVGFTWGGWVTGGKAEASATQRANAAVVTALAPFCVEKFQHTTDVSANLAALKKTDSWSQGDFVEKGGWATLPGSNSPEQVTAVAKACASLLASA
jgi:hypothetical protein